MYEILIYPHPGLNTVAKEVTVFDEQLKNTSDELLATMYASNGIGLAASQVDVHQRIFVMDTSSEGNNPQVLINPVITQTEGSTSSQEGCLSFPGLYIDVTRAESITVQAQDLSGNFTEITATGLVARCIQHELDHLDGRVFVDRLSRLKRQRALKKYQKIIKAQDQ